MHSGTVRISLQCDRETDACLHIRLPGYLNNPKLLVDGREAPLKIKDGYVVLPIKDKLKVELQGDAKARLVAANRNVRADLGKVAIMKGPFVYCLEETDNGSHLPSLSVRLDAALEEGNPEPGLPGDLPTVTFAGQRLTRTIPVETGLYGEPSFVQEEAALKAVPYALWCNREPGEMLVWLRARM